MPSFDVVSEINLHELQNALEQTRSELKNRFDFKDVKTSVEFKEKENEVYLGAPSDFQLQQLQDIFKSKVVKRNIDIRSFDFEAVSTNLHEATQVVVLKQGIEQAAAKDIIKQVKDGKFKVQATIQGDKIRVTGKDRDELQNVIQFLRKAEVKLPLNFENFRD